MQIIRFVYLISYAALLLCLILVKPRIAVGYHFYNDFDTQPEVNRRVRKTYDGPLSLALDYMVWNVSKDDIKVRMAAKDEEVWPSTALKVKLPPRLLQKGSHVLDSRQLIGFLNRSPNDPFLISAGARRFQRPRFIPHLWKLNSVSHTECTKLFYK